MSSHGVILPVAQSPNAEGAVVQLREWWSAGLFAVAAHPRAYWLSTTERVLGYYFPHASSRDRNLTARSLAPFPLRNRP